MARVQLVAADQSNELYFCDIQTVNSQWITEKT